MPNRTRAPLDLSTAPNEALVTAQEAADYFRIHRNSLWRWSRAGHIPKPLRVGPNSLRWRIGDLRNALRRDG